MCTKNPHENTQPRETDKQTDDKACIFKMHGFNLVLYKFEPGTGAQGESPPIHCGVPSPSGGPGPFPAALSRQGRPRDVAKAALSRQGRPRDAPKKP